MQAMAPLAETFALEGERSARRREVAPGGRTHSRLQTVDSMFSKQRSAFYCGDGLGLADLYVFVFAAAVFGSGCASVVTVNPVLLSLFCLRSTK